MGGISACVGGGEEGTTPVSLGVLVGVRLASAPPTCLSFPPTTLSAGLLTLPLPSMPSTSLTLPHFLVLFHYFHQTAHSGTFLVLPWFSPSALHFHQPESSHTPLSVTFVTPSLLFRDSSLLLLTISIFPCEHVAF